MKRKENPPKRSYMEVMEDFKKANTPKEYRAVNKEMKQNGYGSVPVWCRYPDLPYYVSVLSLILAIIMTINKVT